MFAFLAKEPRVDNFSVCFYTQSELEIKEESFHITNYEQTD
jgi:hypothetical protein